MTLRTGTRPSLARGFTLVELVMVIVIMGVVAGIVATFMKNPIDAYFATVRRAGLVDMADTVARRMARDLRKTLPNSVRVPSATCLELIPTKTGGRYRIENIAANDGTALEFDRADTSFNMLGRNSTLPLDQRIASGDIVAIYNLGQSGSDAYAQENTTAVSGTPTEADAASGVGKGWETTVPLTGKQFPYASPGSRFQVIPQAEQIVSYVCTGTALAPGDIVRTVRPLSAAATGQCVTTVGGAGGVTNRALIAKNASCSFDYSGTDLQRNGQVSIVFNFTESGETVRLQQDVHVNNAP